MFLVYVVTKITNWTMGPVSSYSLSFLLMVTIMMTTIGFYLLIRGRGVDGKREREEGRKTEKKMCVCVHMYMSYTE